MKTTLTVGPVRRPRSAIHETLLTRLHLNRDDLMRAADRLIKLQSARQRFPRENAEFGCQNTVVPSRQSSQSILDQSAHRSANAVVGMTPSAASPV